MELRKNGSPPNSPYTTLDYNSLSYGQYRDITVRYLADIIGSHAAAIRVFFLYDGLSQYVDIGLAGETVDAPVAQLWLDDTLIASEETPVQGADLDKLILSVNHPYSDDGGNFCDQSVSFTLKRGSTYAIVYDFGSGENGRLLEKRRRRLNTYLETGYSDTSTEVLTETLNVIGMTWLHDVTLNNHILQNLSDVILVNHHRFGIVAQENGYYVDARAQLGSVSSRTSDTEAKIAFIKGFSHLASAMEHGVLEQMQVDSPAVSTVKLLQITNSDEGRVYKVTADNYDDIVTSSVWVQR